MKNCHVCNQLCDDNAEVCPICGAFLEEAEAENERAIGVYRKFGFEVLPYMELKK